MPIAQPVNVPHTRTYPVRQELTANLLRFMICLNRSLSSTAAVLGMHRIGYLVAFTIIMIFAGGAAMAAFKNPASLSFNNSVSETSGESNTYTEFVWWSASVIAAVETNYRPRTVEGRVINLLLSLYSLGIFSCLTATVASFFVGAQRKQEAAEQTKLQQEIGELCHQLARFTNQLQNLPDANRLINWAADVIDC